MSLTQYILKQMNVHQYDQVQQTDTLSLSLWLTANWNTFQIKLLVRVRSMSALLLWKSWCFLLPDQQLLMFPLVRSDSSVLLLMFSVHKEPRLMNRTWSDPDQFRFLSTAAASETLRRNLQTAAQGGGAPCVCVFFWHRLCSPNTFSKQFYWTHWLTDWSTH